MEHALHADMRVSGAFRTGSAETFARALSVALPITSSVDEEEGAIVLRAQPQVGPVSSFPRRGAHEHKDAVCARCRRAA